MVENILSIKRLRTYFWNRKDRQFVRAVDEVDLRIPRGKTLGLVGESASGKSTVARAIMGLVQGTPGVIDGEILLRYGKNEERNILDGLNTRLKYHESVITEVVKDNISWIKQREKQMRGIRGKEISMIFQEYSAALNPVMTVGSQLSETIRKHCGLNRQDAKNEALKWLGDVGIGRASQRMKQYPGELAGGMKQRVMTALALCSKPSLLIADEPTTGLDATTQTMIIDLLEKIKCEQNFSMLLITHDLGVVSRLADQVAVMYAGRIVEIGPKNIVLYGCCQAKHPYTAGLLEAVVSMKPIMGKPASSDSNRPEGCRFFDRCSIQEDSCIGKQRLIEYGEEHLIRCWKAKNRKQKKSS